jgi:Reverse transcriptase (RNA-dependent DNA polymerase)
VCPNQVRSRGHIVNECPLQYVSPSFRTPDTHSILVDDVRIKLMSHGVISYFNVRRPTQEELQDSNSYPQLEMTNSSDWDPYSHTFEEFESSIHSTLKLNKQVTEHDNRYINSFSYYCCNISKQLMEEDLPIDIERNVIVSAISTMEVAKSTRKGTVTPEELSSKWFIGLSSAKRTIEQTTQRGVRDFLATGGYKRMKHSTYQLMYKHIWTSVYTETMFSRIKSLQQNTCAQVYVTTFHWTRVYPMRLKSEARLTLDRLHEDVGIFHTVIPDNAPELIHGEFKRKVLKAGSSLKPVEAYTHNQNLAESAIRKLRRMYRKAMTSTNAPHVLWDHCFSLMAEIRSNTAIDLPQLQGDTPNTMLTGDTVDISHLCEFQWYQRIWYVDPNDKINNRKLGRYLGPSHDIGQAMCCKLLTNKARVISRTSVVPLTIEDKNSILVKEQIETYDNDLKTALGDRMQGIEIPDNDGIPEYEPYEDTTTEPIIIPEADDIDLDATHKFLSARVMLPHGGQLSTGRVIRRKRDHDGVLIGRSDNNPILDTSMYDVEFEDGHIEAFSANTIAEHVYEQVGEDGYIQLLLDEILDHRSTAEAIRKDDSTTTSGKPRPTTKGWHLCVRWKDGSTSWEKLSSLKDGYPVQVAEYATANKLVSEPAFQWWVPYTQKKRHRIIHQLKTRYLRREEKFGLPLPKSVKEALAIDRDTNTSFWSDAIKKEMSVILPAVKILEDGITAPVGYQMIPCHMVFDIKVDFTRKARFVGGGHVTKPPTTQTYASVVSRESVRIAFLYAALNELDIMSADVQGAYLNAPCKEKVYTRCGPEFGPENIGRVALIVKALYGLKTSAYAWREHLSKTLEGSLDFSHCLADNDVWMRPGEKLDGTKYYQLILVHTDDLLVVAEKPIDILTNLDQHYILKKGSIGELTTYLGAEVGRYTLPDDPSRKRWYMGSEKYVKEAIRNVKAWLEERGHSLKMRAPSVLPSGYRPELDTTAYCSEEEGSYYQQQVGVLRWMVELGRIDVAVKVSMLASFTASPRLGHFKAMLHIFSYLNQHTRSKMVFDDSYIKMDDELKQDWTSFYPEAKELIPTNMPEARGKPVQMTAFLDADHAGDIVSRRSQTGVLIYLNKSPIIWYTKKQNSVETSTFGSEFMALKAGVELIKGLRYKLRMLGIHVRVDNMSVVSNSTAPESTLKKKSNAIAYHFVRESVAADIIRITYESSKTNKADVLTKTHTGPERQRIVSGILY